ncbi:transglycosylase SLT domain-containing protein [Methyloversatilis sp.]|uniref:transglycosylase SLT domain-containing protein n=1 Tax=Methyloversatilis sp. TaxID=2569862 RepID=UPI0027BA782E|nr:transglycosylase SLT domain-containing protein [Methyloversatilis sp.]
MPPLIDSLLRRAAILLSGLLLAGCAATGVVSENAGDAPVARSSVSTPDRSRVTKKPGDTSRTPGIKPGKAEPIPFPEPTEIVRAPEDEIKPVDLTLPPDDLWERIRKGFGMADLDHPLVAEHQAWYLNRPDYFRRMSERGRRYMFHIVEEIERRGLPTELALLPMVESAYNPEALSVAKASGLWQFIPSTGKLYGLEQNAQRDDRRDIVASTQAALEYLQKIYEMHGDWHLALASYNWGEGAVGRAVLRNQAAGLPTDYASLNMPAETRHYVPKLQALKNIIAQPELFGIELESVENKPYFAQVAEAPSMDLATAARLADVPVAEIKALNPQHKRPVIRTGKGGAQLVLPAHAVDTFMANLDNRNPDAAPTAGAPWRTYTLGPKETLATVIRRFGVSEWRLRRFNGLSPTVRIGPGSTLLVPDENSSLSLDGGNAEEAPRLGVDKPKYKRVKRNGRWVNVPVTPAAGSKAVKPGVQKRKVSAPPARKKTVIPAGKSATGK